MAWASHWRWNHQIGTKPARAAAWAIDAGKQRLRYMLMAALLCFHYLFI
jgi:hypothetical protein